jgi:FAD/FMN-containing dehydrogenase
MSRLEYIDRAEAMAALKAAVGPAGWRDDPADLAPHLTDWRGKYRGAASMLLLPQDATQVAAIVRIAQAFRLRLVPQGGNTGLVGGSVPDASGREILLNLKRMNRIRALDADDFSITAEAGCILASVQQAARGAERLFPLSLGSEGSAQIGGLISTNAGGVAVLRYGTMRSLVLGLEAVLPDGSMLNGLSSLRKDNTGYDIKQLLIGAEGTLGIITAATLKLFPQPKASATAFVALADPQAAVGLLSRLRAATADQVSAFELIPHEGLELVLRHIPGTRAPLASPAPWYVLVEATSADPAAPLAAQMEAGLAAAAQAGLVADGAIAATLAQAQAFWRIRETLPEAEKLDGGALKHDVSVPVSQMPGFMLRAQALVEQAIPGGRVLAFGHLGDGNVHFNVRAPAGADQAAWLAQWQAATADLLYGEVARLGGSLSAEHGIGRLKAAALATFADPAKLAAMRAVKAALDPHGVFNPGVLFTNGAD